MKLSLRWVCDHLSLSWNKVPVEKLVEYFNTRVAEIEVFTPVRLPLEKLFFGVVTSLNGEQPELSVPELKKTITLPVREELLLGASYLLIKEGNQLRWASHIDLDGTKENLLPALSLEPKLLEGGWKKSVEADDVILEVDNKSITHRPDLWSHRGFAREIARFTKATVVDEKKLLVKIPEKTAATSFDATKAIPVCASIETDACKRFAVLPFTHVVNKPTSLFMALRLARVDSRVINAVIDATNYVMFDWGQPLHAFDAQQITTHTLIPRQAKKNEKLTLLDGTVLNLVPEDMVITDGHKPFALAGVKGGLDSGVSETTTSLLVESATFVSGVVRMGAARHGLRTEASARFEKSLDPHQNVAGIERFVKLLDTENITYTCAPALVSLGTLPKPTVITMKQSFIERCLSVQFKKDEVKKILESIGFTVTQKTTGNDVELKITVPTYRATKDIHIQEDIVEEVGRLYGYNALHAELPVFAKKPTDDQWVDRLFTVKNFLARAGHMREVATYSFVDQEFAKKIGWHVQNPVSLRNPIAQHRSMMLDDIVPALLQVLEENKADHEQMRLFEWARTWYKKGTAVREKQVLAGLMYHKKESVNFYTAKDLLNNLAALMGASFDYKPTKQAAWWANEHISADILLDNKIIGSLSAVSAVTMARLDGGHALVFTLDGQALADYKQPLTTYTPLAKFQGTYIDMSALFKQDTAVHTIEQTIKGADKRITQVMLWDMFSKPEWQGKRSLTFRCFVQDDQRTMTKEDTDHIMHAAQKSLEKLGGEVR